MKDAIEVRLVVEWEESDFAEETQKLLAEGFRWVNSGVNTVETPQGFTSGDLFTHFYWAILERPR